MKKIIISVISILVLTVIFFILYNIGYDNYKANNDIMFVEDKKVCSNCYVVKKDENTDTKNIYYKKLVNENIDEVLKQEIDFDNMVLLYNPYDNNKKQIEIYFKTHKEVSVKVTVNRKEKVLYKGYAHKDIHYYVINGLKPNSKNKFKIELIDKNNNIVDSENKIINLVGD